MGGGTVPPRLITVSAVRSTVRSQRRYRGRGDSQLTNATLQFRSRMLIEQPRSRWKCLETNKAGILRVTNTLRMANNATILGNPAFDMGNNPAQRGLSREHQAGGLTVNNYFPGGGNSTGNFIQGTAAVRRRDGTRRNSYSQRKSVVNAGTLRFRYFE